MAFLRSSACVAVALFIGSLSGCAEDSASGAGGEGLSGGAGGGTGNVENTGGSVADGGAGGGTGACAEDCSAIDTPACLRAVCNEGQLPGTIGECAVVPDDGAECEDGLFCTVKDVCSGGVCAGGPQNNCGQTAPACTNVVCVESSQSCTTAPAGQGDPCAPGDLCQIGGACNNGVCVGTPKDCSFSPYAECNTVACNPANGACEPTPSVALNGAACSLTGDLCKVGKTCQVGQCQGGTDKDCSALTVNCTNGTCDPISGACVAEAVPPGGMCAQATDECNVGICDALANCQPMPKMDGTSCNDFDSCTSGDACLAGACDGTAVSGCTTYLSEGFETCPNGWTFAGDWACGSPTVVGPTSAHTGSGLIATRLNANYSGGQAFATSYAESPSLNLGSATNPTLTFWAWTHSETDYDGFDVRVSTNGGATYSLVTTVSPPYNSTAGSGDEAVWATDTVSGWQPYIVDLTAFAGQTIKLRFAFASDTVVQRPGVYIDDLLMAEANAVPLNITTSSLPQAFVAQPFAATVNRLGGSPAATWSIVGGTNHAWLSIQPSTGVLSGTPLLANLGAGTVTVRVQEPSLPSNFAERTLNFEVVQAVYSQTFDGACASNGWALTGDWQCGTPTSVGPATAFSGTQCIATQIAASYTPDQFFSSTTATSPAINLAGTTSPLLSFRTWVSTEDGYDGFNLKVSTNGGSSFAPVTSVTPAYDQVLTENAWGGDQSSSGWQVYQADLSAYAGQSVLLRFAFESDFIVSYPGVYIDDVVVAD